MKFDLVGHERRIDDADRLPQHSDRIVRHSDIARVALFMGLLQKAERRRDITICRGPMEEQHIDVIGAKVLQALFDRRQESFV